MVDTREDTRLRFEQAQKAGKFGGGRYTRFSPLGGEASPPAIFRGAEQAVDPGPAWEPRDTLGQAQAIQTGSAPDYGREGLERPGREAPRPKMGPSLAGITTQRPFMTSDEEFKRLGGFNPADVGIINARIRERQGAQANTAAALSPTMARVTDAQGRTMYTGAGTGATGDDAEMVSRGMVKDRYGNWTPAGGWGDQSGLGDAQPQQAIGAEQPDMSSIPALFAWSARARAASKEKSVAEARRTEAVREQGAMSRVEREAELRRQATGEERAAGIPEREARVGESQARAKLLGTQEEIAQLGTIDAREYAHLRAQVENEDLAKTNPALVQKSRERLKAIEEKNMRQKIAIEAAKQKAMMGEEFADGGEVQGYADGGAIGRAQTGQLNPMVAQYGQYLQAAAQTGVAPVPFTQYINLLGSTRGAMQGTPTQFADGGDVSALNRPLEGPGTGRSDSIPAVIDGEQPAALSRGEFVIPEHVVRKKGTEFFEKLIAQYAEGAPANG